MQLHTQNLTLLEPEIFLKDLGSPKLSSRAKVKLKLQYFGHLMRRVDSLEKILMLRKTEGRRRRE